MPHSEDRTNKSKKKFIEALEKSLGIVLTACKSTGLSRTQHYKWMNEDSDYKKAVEGVQESVIDFVESKLYKQIKDENTTATIFFLKTKGKSRGYIEKSEIDLKIEKQMDLSKLSDEELDAFILLSEKAKVDTEA